GDSDQAGEDLLVVRVRELDFSSLPRGAPRVVLLQLAREQLAPPHEQDRGGHENGHEHESERLPQEREALAPGVRRFCRSAAARHRFLPSRLASLGHPWVPSEPSDSSLVEPRRPTDCNRHRSSAHERAFSSTALTVKRRAAPYRSRCHSDRHRALQPKPPPPFRWCARGGTWAITVRIDGSGALEEDSCRSNHRFEQGSFFAFSTMRARAAAERRSCA